MSETVNDSIFDKVIAGEIPVDTVYEDNHVLAFRDINPQAPVHVLVVPKKRVARFAEITALAVRAIGVFFSSVSRVAESLGLNGKGYRIVINNGSDGGQEVEYLHAHILGGRRMKWPPG